MKRRKQPNKQAVKKDNDQQDRQRLFVYLKTPYKKYQLLHGHLFLEQKKSLRETKLRANIEQRLEVKLIPSPIHISLQQQHRLLKS